MRATSTLARDIESIGADILGDDFTVEATGMMPLAGGWIDEIVTGQRNGVLTSILSITVLMMLGLGGLPSGSSLPCRTSCPW